MRLNASSDGFCIRTAYSVPTRVVKVCEGEDLTKQSFKDECDINKAIERYKRAGVMPVLPQAEPFYGDVSSMDFQEAQFFVRKAVELFESLPAELRARFNNQAGKMVEFIEDPANVEEAIKLGLMKPKETAPAAAVAAAAAPAPAGGTPPPAPQAASA